MQIYWNKRKRLHKKRIFDISKFILGSEAWGNKTKEMYYLLLSLEMIYFPLFPQASQPSMNLNISQLVYRLGTLTTAAVSLFWNTNMAAMTSCENALQLFAVKGAIYYAAIATVIFSRVKISCFRRKAHLVFHW